MSKPKALDLFCGAGGATKGLQEAGFHVTGVDLVASPRYIGDAFIQADALTVPLDGYDFIWASPPCQRFSGMTNCRGTQGDHEDLIWSVRARLRAAGVPYVIENVTGAPLLNPLMLCGAMFPGLKVYRHRLFETSFPLLAPGHPRHVERTGRAGHGVGPNGWISVAGHLYNEMIPAAKAAMGIDWMTRDELAQAIPPAFSRFIGEQAIRVLEAAA